MNNGISILNHSFPIGPFLDISDDIIFKRVFGRRANKGVLITLLNRMLPDIRVSDLEYLSPETTGFSRENRNSRMDLRCRLDTGHEVIIEVQVRDQHDFKDRAVYYATLPILEEVEAGAELYHLTPRYVVAFIHFALEHEDDPHWLDEYRSFYSLREKTTGEKLSEAINIVFVELGRFKKSLQSIDNDLERWYFCLKEMGRLESRPEEFSTQEMRDLFETVQIESLSKAEKKDYARYMTTERDIRNQWNFAMEKATAEGLEKGLAQGREEGKEEERVNAARNLKALGVSVEIISKATGLSLEQIKAL